MRTFAASGKAPADAILQHALWYGDQDSWPDFPLYGATWQPVALGPGRPRLIDFGFASGSDAAAFAQMDSLRSRHPEVEFA